MASDRRLMAAKTMGIDMLLLGKTGNGKSSTGNSILLRKIFKASGKSTSVTAKIKSEWSRYKDDDGRHYDLKVTDGPGLEDTNLNNLQDKKRAYLNIANVLSECPQGIHAFLVVFKMGNRFTKEDKHSLESLKEILGNDFLRKFGVIIVTGGDDLHADEDDREGRNFQDWCTDQEGELKLLMQECDNRCVLFDNRTKDKAVKKEQLDTLLVAVQEIISRNNGERYTNENFKKYEESHKKLLNECDLTYIKEEFRKQLSLLEEEVRKMVDKNDEPNKAHEMLQNLLGQVEYEITHTPRLELLQKDLLKLKELLAEVEKLKEAGESYDSVLKEAANLCTTMVKAASPPVNLEWLEKVLERLVVCGGPIGIVLGGVIGLISMPAMAVIALREKLGYHY